jgi:O-antigen biosynthesis protein WbqP
MKRIFDLILGIIILIILIIPMLLIFISIRISSKGSGLYWSKRMGQNNIIFKMPKFRTMEINTPSVASHLLDNPDGYLSSIGGFLRATSLDELPQLFSVLKGDMSFVGPRPALYNQDDLIALRVEKGIDKLMPGITGWAQVNGRDELTIHDKVTLDEEYMTNKSFMLDLKILFVTFLKVVKKDGVSH